MESYGEHVYGKDRTDEMMSRLERIERMLDRIPVTVELTEELREAMEVGAKVIERSKTYSNRYAEVLRKAARK